MSLLMTFSNTYIMSFDCSPSITLPCPIPIDPTSFPASPPSRSTGEVLCARSGVTYLRLHY